MIKYQCDNCGQDIYETEAIGPGVFTTDPNGQIVQGKARTYSWDGGKAILTIQLHRPDSLAGCDQFCYACMWKALREFIRDYAPDSLLIEVSNEDIGTSDVTDTKLSELHAEGVLPEAGITSDPLRRFGTDEDQPDQW